MNQEQERTDLGISGSPLGRGSVLPLHRAWAPSLVRGYTSFHMNPGLTPGSRGSFCLRTSMSVLGSKPSSSLSFTFEG